MSGMRHRIELVHLLPKNPVTCEVGVAEGFFSRDICKQWRPSKHYLVDLWAHIPNVTGDGNSPQEWHDKNFNAAKDVLKEYDLICRWLRGVSWEVATGIKDESLDIVYLDAAHYYEAVIKDLYAYYPKVKPGGIIAGHDYLNTAYGVNQAANEVADLMRVDVHTIPENHPDNASFYFIKPK